MAYDNPRAPEGTKLVLIAVGLGLVAVILTLLWGDRIKKANRVATEKVCTFRHKVTAGQVIQKDDFQTIELPTSFHQILFGETSLNCLPPEQLEGYVGKEPYKHDAVSGEFVRLYHFTESGSSAPTEPPQGKVWVTLPINSANTGALVVGAHVNIAAPFNKPLESAPRSIAVMANVRIEALGQYTVEDVSTGPGKTMRVGGYRTFRIEADPKDANMLADLRRRAVGDFELVVCNATDKPAFVGINRDLLRMLKLDPVQIP
jgi:Flp pilus assembly protein CpaB